MVPLLGDILKGAGALRKSRKMSSLTWIPARNAAALSRISPGQRRVLAFFPRGYAYLEIVTVETFKPEIAEAMIAYDRYVVCIDKTPDEFQTTLQSLLKKAIKAYETRGPELRHGIALDKYVTVILSQNDNPRPFCGIYFNLHSPYQKQTAAKPAKAQKETIGGEG
jgi:hypothetical protein